MPQGGPISIYRIYIYSALRAVNIGEELATSRHVDHTFSGAHDSAMHLLKGKGEALAIAFRIEEYQSGRPGVTRAWSFDRHGRLYSGSDLPTDAPIELVAPAWTWRPGVVVAFERQGYLMFGVIAAVTNDPVASMSHYTVRLPVTQWDGTVVEQQLDGSHFLPYPDEVKERVLRDLAELMVDEGTMRQLLGRLHIVDRDPRVAVHVDHLVAPPIKEAVTAVFYILDREERFAALPAPVDSTELGTFDDANDALAAIQSDVQKGPATRLFTQYSITRLGVAGRNVYGNQTWLGEWTFNADGQLLGWNEEQFEEVRRDGVQEQAFHIGDVVGTMTEGRLVRPSIVVKLPKSHIEVSPSGDNSNNYGAYSLATVRRTDRSWQENNSATEDAMLIYDQPLSIAIRRQLALQLLTDQDRQIFAAKLYMAPGVSVPDAWLDCGPSERRESSESPTREQARFFDRFITGEAGVEQFHDAIHEWHSAKTELSVSAYLGISPAIYHALLRWPAIVGLARDLAQKSLDTKATLIDLEARVIEELDSLTRLRETWHTINSQSEEPSCKPPLA